MNILITAATSAQAHQLKKKLDSDQKLSGTILLGDHLELPAFMISSGKMVKLPHPDSVAYTHEMLTLCLDKEIAKVYVFNAKEINLLMEAEQLFREYGIEIIANEV